MTPEQYQKFKQSIKQTQQRGQKMIARINNTLQGVRQTIKGIQENEEKISQFQKAFDDVMTQLAYKLAGSFGNSFKKIQGKHYDHMPQRLPFPQLVKRMMSHSQILIITGAGVSLPSGIPTFRGQGGLYSKQFQWQGQKYPPEQFITNAFYQKHPKAIWQWVDFIYKMSTECKANDIHRLIDQLAKVLSKRGKAVTIVTQNIDALHIKPEKDTYSYSEIHGNVNFVRCKNNHLSSYKDFRIQILEGHQAKCPICGQLLRPHVLFFDESYGPLYGNQVKDKSFPFVFVIGSSLSTGLCSSFARKAQQIVEINPYPVIQVGRVYQYKQPTQNILEQIIDHLGQKK